LFWNKNRHKDHGNRTESLEINQYIYIQMIFSKSPVSMHWRKDRISSIMFWKLDIYILKNEIWSLSLTITNLNLRCEARKLVVEYIGKLIQGTWMDKKSLDETSKHRKQKQKKNKMGWHHTKSFGSAKETVIRRKYWTMLLYIRTVYLDKQSGEEGESVYILDIKMFCNSKDSLIQYYHSSFDTYQSISLNLNFTLFTSFLQTTDSSRCTIYINVKVGGISY
jgi:hypothetical protein